MEAQTIHSADVPCAVANERGIAANNESVNKQLHDFVDLSGSMQVGSSSGPTQSA